MILGENRPFTEIPAALVPIVSQWGLDPLWDTTLAQAPLAHRGFPGASHRRNRAAARVRDHERSCGWTSGAMGSGRGASGTATSSSIRAPPTCRLSGSRSSATSRTRLPARRSRRSCCVSSRRCCRGGASTFARTGAQVAFSPPRHRAGARPNAVPARQRLSGHLVQPAAGTGDRDGPKQDRARASDARSRRSIPISHGAMSRCWPRACSRRAVRSPVR